MKFLIKWKYDLTRQPANREELAKLLLSQAEEVKAALKTGTLKDWGLYVSGGSGYLITEAASETDLYTQLRRWRPYIQFEISEPTMTIEQSIEMVKKAAATTAKK